MKLILCTLIALITIPAFSFSTITLKKEIQLSSVRPGSGYVVGKEMTTSGDQDCSLELAKESALDTDAVTAGTVLLVSGPVYAACGEEPYSFCSASYSGSSLDKKVSFNLLCRDTRTYPVEISAEMINRISSRSFFVQ